MRKEICFIIANAFSYAGTENICNFMTDSLGIDYDITIVSLNGNGETFYPFKKAKRIISLHDKKLKIFNSLILTRKYGKDGVFIISMGKLSAFYGLCSILSMKSLNKTIACEHVSINSFSNKVREFKLFFLKRYFKVVTLTDSDLEFLVSRQVDAIKIHNPIFEKNNLRSSRSKIALAVGRLDYQKGFDRLLHIWSRFVVLNPGWRLKIAGEGEMRGELNKIIETLQLSESVELLGKVKNVDSLYKDADIFLMTSRYEGLPMVLLEAKAWGLPTIAFNCQTGPKEVINNGVDGFLIDDESNDDFVSAMNELASDNEKYFEMSLACKETIEKFSAKNICKEWEKLADSMSV